MKKFINIKGVYKNYCWQDVVFERPYDETVEVKPQVTFPIFKTKFFVTQSNGNLTLSGDGQSFSLSETESDFFFEESEESFQDERYNEVKGKIKLIIK